MKRKFGLGLTVLVLSGSLAGLGGCEVEDAADNGRTQAQRQAAKLKQQVARAKAEQRRKVARAKRMAKAAAQAALAEAQAAAAVESEPVPVVESTPSDCDPNYSGACLDPNAYDYDCEGGSGDGPEYTGYVQVVGDDPHDLDSDSDGTGCE